MSPIARERLFGIEHAFDSPATALVLTMVVAVLLLVPIIFWFVARAVGADPGRLRNWWRRNLARLVLVALFALPILAGAFWAIVLVGVLSLFCYREYARATGLFREKLISLLVALTILAIHLTVLDNWYNAFVALFSLAIAAIGGVALVQDRPMGYIQRVALGTFAFVLFGSCLGHLGFLANSSEYRPLMIFFVGAVEINDVGAFVIGRTLGRRQLCPNTSPDKTVAGAAGGIVFTTVFVFVAGRLVFAETLLQHWLHGLILGVLVSVAAQLGDLMLSSIKRDLGLKTMDVIVPGHGGLLDHIDSLLLAAPVLFHYVNYYVGVSAGQPICIFTGAR
jgi:phosphatidate cytidylyltransferase